MKRSNGWKGGLLAIRAAAVMLMFLTVGLVTPRSAVADDPPPPSCEDYTIAACLYPWACEAQAEDPCGGARGEQCEDQGYVACVDLPQQQCSKGAAMVCLFEGDGGGGGID
jgi:hypothetical protein